MKHTTINIIKKILIILNLFISSKIIFFVAVFFSVCSFVFAQTETISVQKVKTISNDTTKLEEIKSPSGVDTTITFYAADTVRFNPSTKRMLLRGNAKIDFKTQTLTADIIEIDFSTSILYARFSKDSSGKIVGIPKFNDSGEEFFGEEIVYNFKNKTGSIKSGETQMGEGFYFGENIKRISENELLIKNGYYTTCDAPEPHYHFGSHKMKMIVGNKIFADPLIFYVENIPVFVIPFGLFLPIEKGRRSGFILPSFYFSKSRGVVFQNLGFYWAASNYWDTKITTDIYSKGGFLLNTDTRWALKDIFNGNAQISYGKTRFSLDDEFTQEWRLILNHNHKFSPFENLNVNLNLASQDFNRNTSTNLNHRVQTNIHSSAAYSRTFENGINASLSFQNDQDIITTEYQGRVPLSISVPQFPLKRLVDIKANQWYSWLRDITFSYRTSANYNFDKKQVINSYQDQDNTIFDTSFTKSSTKYITHSPQISISPKFGYFTITPSINFGANNYFRKLEKNFVPQDSSIQENFTNGFFTEYNYSFGIGASTRLYGIADSKQRLLGFIDPNSLGIKAIRHTYQPSINFNYTPDFSQEKYGFYGKYVDEKTGQDVIYSYFEKEGGSHASRYLQKRISYSDMHSLEIKKSGANDSLPDENIELLRLALNGSYNFAADSLKFSDIGLSLRTPAINFLEFSGNANFTLYDEVKIKNEKNNYEYFTKVNQFLISNNKGLARLTNFSFNVSTSFSSDGLIGVNDNHITNKDTTAEEQTENLNLGARFDKRNDRSGYNDDLFATNSPGYSPIRLPWSVNLGMNFNYNHAVIDRISRTLNLHATLNLTIADTWNISTTLQYDFINLQLIAPQINVSKDFHCWNLTAHWYPTGYNQGFYLRFGIKSSQLQDLKIEKRDSPIFR